MAELRWLSLVVCLACPLFAQQPPPSSTQSTGLIPRSQAEREREIQVERHIILNVLVTDTTGKPVRGLIQQDFTLLDNQQPQTIATFKAVEGSAPDAHVHVILMLDALDNSSKDLRNERKEVEKFLGQNQGRLAYPVSIGLLTDSGGKVGKGSLDGNALISELKQLPMTGSAPVENDPVEPWHSAGKMTVNNISTDEELSRRNRHFLLAVPSLMQLAKRQEDVPGRVLLEWIGPGWPLLAGPEFHADSLKAQTSFFAYIVDLSSALRVAQMTLDEVSPTNLVKHPGVRPQGDDPQSYLLLKDGSRPSKESDDYRVFLNGVPALSDAKAGDLALPVLAYQSGGRIMDQSQDLAGEIAQCIADAESYYVLSFDSSPAKSPDEYHSLQLKVDKPGMTVHTTRAYYAQQ